jgi:hypothetical protein
VKHRTASAVLLLERAEIKLRHFQG